MSDRLGPARTRGSGAQAWRPAWRPPRASSWVRVPDSARRPSSRTSTRSARAARLTSWLTMAGAAGGQARQRGEEVVGRPRVECGGRLVEDEDGRVAHEGAGDRDAQEPAAGQPGEAAVVERGDESVRPCRTGGPPDLLVGRARPAAGDVLPDAAAEDAGAQRQQCDRLPQPVERQVPEVGAVQPDQPRVRVVEAHQQREQRGLAGAARPGDRHHLAGMVPPAPGQPKWTPRGSSRPVREAAVGYGVTVAPPVRRMPISRSAPAAAAVAVSPDPLDPGTVDPDPVERDLATDAPNRAARPVPADSSDRRKPDSRAHPGLIGRSRVPRRPPREGSAERFPQVGPGGGEGRQGGAGGTRTHDRRIMSPLL